MDICESVLLYMWMNVWMHLCTSFRVWFNPESKGHDKKKENVRTTVLA